VFQAFREIEWLVIKIHGVSLDFAVGRAYAKASHDIDDTSTLYTLTYNYGLGLS